jgi:hypothetical protein
MIEPLRRVFIDDSECCSPSYAPTLPNEKQVPRSARNDKS